MKKTVGIAVALAGLVWVHSWLNAQNNTQQRQEMKLAVDYSTIGNEVTCPVMNTNFNITKDTPKVEYKGKTYFFCCSGCVEKFNKEPEKYISVKGRKKANNCCDHAGKKEGVKHVGKCAGCKMRCDHVDRKEGVKHNCNMTGKNMKQDAKYDSKDEN